MNNELKTFLLVGITSLGLMACGGGGGSGDDGGNGGGRVSLSAQLGTSYNIAAPPGLSESLLAALFGKKAMAINTASIVDKVVAIPSYSGSLAPADLDNMQTASLNGNGRFSLSLQTSYDWVILLVNSNASSIDDKVAGYVTATIDSENTLVAFPGSELSSDLDMGTLESDGVNEAQSSTDGTQNAASFKLSLKELKSIAKSDDSYKHLINLYLNYDPATKTAYQPQLSYTWNAGSISSTGNAIPTASTIDAYQAVGFNVGIETANINAALKDGICSGTTLVELIPPAAVSNVDSSRSWDTTNNFTNNADYSPTCALDDTACMNIGADPSSWLQSNGSENRYYCYDADFAIQIPLSVNGALINFGWGPLSIPATGLPQGTWVYKVDGSEVAWFDLAVASPVNSAGKFTTTPVPAINMAYDSVTGLISGIAITWFQFDPETDIYVALTPEQENAFDAIVNDSFISVIDDTGTLNRSGSVHLGSVEDAGFSSNGLVDGSGITFPIESNAWYLPGSAGDQPDNLVPTTISIGLSMSGVSYFFGWSNDIYPTNNLDTPFEIGYEETVNIDGATQQLRFTDVSEDSRCPIGVTCVWHGTVSILMDAAGTEPFQLQLGGDLGSNSAAVGDHLITLSGVSPYPGSGESLAPENYSATVTVSALASHNVDTPFSIGIGETVNIESAIQHLRVSSVVEDSRCPTGVTCIWPGRVAISIDLDETATPVELSLFDDPPNNTASIGNYLLTLTDVTPYPAANETINPADYAFSFLVEAL